jgi:hypothetical protein
MRFMTVPQFYPDLCVNMLDALDYSREKDIDGTAYVTGSPGTGKSAFIHYLIFTILQRHPDAWHVYQPRHSHQGAEVWFGGKLYLCNDLKETI